MKPIALFVMEWQDMVRAGIIRRGASRQAQRILVVIGSPVRIAPGQRGNGRPAERLSLPAAVPKRKCQIPALHPAQALWQEPFAFHAGNVL